MRKEINLFKVIIQIAVIIFAILSFLPCVLETESGSVDMFASQWDTGKTFGNAKWVVLSLSVMEIFLLSFDKKIFHTVFKVFSIVSFIVTLLWPIYLIAVSPSIDGSSFGYEWTTLGYIVLTLSLLIPIGFIAYEIVKKRNTGSV